MTTTSYLKEGTRKLFWRRKTSGETTKQTKDVIQRDAAYLLRIRNWGDAARDRGVEEGEAMVRKRAEAPYKKLKYNELFRHCLASGLIQWMVRLRDSVNTLMNMSVPQAPKYIHKLNNV
jgi:hypothetical protein